jgi:hypothetical protein
MRNRIIFFKVLYKILICQAQRAVYVKCIGIFEIVVRVKSVVFAEG